MAIEKAAIITDVNANLQTRLSDLDVYIQKVLDDLSEEDLLVGADDEQTLSSGDTTLDYPTGFRSEIAITLTNASGVTDAPLDELPGGHEEYRDLRDSDSATGIPEFYSRFNKKFYLWRPPGASFTTLIEYYKNHPQGVDTIEFGDEFRNAVYAGTTYYYALKLGRVNAINLWGPIYADAKQKRINATPKEPQISEG